MSNARMVSEVTARLHAQFTELRPIISDPSCTFTGHEIEQLMIAAYLIGVAHGIEAIEDALAGKPNELLDSLPEELRRGL